MSIPTVERLARYAGFWRRFLAFIIDWLIVATMAFVVFAPLALIEPRLANHLVLETPLDIFTTDKTLSEVESVTSPVENGATVTVSGRTVERTVAGTWTYHYKVTRRTTTPASGSPTYEEDWQLVDRETGQPIDTTRLDSIIAFVLLVYLIVMEAGPRQASFGKVALGIRVTNLAGGKPTLGQSVIRNIAKILSVLTLFVGFMMAGWTRHKQALHDKVASALIVVDEPPP